jgi:hypothetical protein
VRSINLLKLALDAEILYLRAMLARQARRAAFGSVALIFALVVLALAEIAAWQGLRLRFEAIRTTLILFGINLVIAAVFGVLAARSAPGHGEQEALRVRQQALDGARGSLVFATAVPAATRLLGFGGKGRRASWFGLRR